MTTTRVLPVTADELLVVVSDLWDAAFGQAPMPIDDDPEADDALWGQVDIVDDHGPVAEVTVICNGPVLRAVARGIFGVDPPQPAQERAVVAEAANIVAGNVKGIIRLRTSLSLPRSGAGTPPMSVDPGGPACRQLTVRAGNGRRLRVLVRVTDLYAARPELISREEEMTL